MLHRRERMGFDRAIGHERVAPQPWRLVAQRKSRRPGRGQLKHQFRLAYRVGLCQNARITQIEMKSVDIRHLGMADADHLLASVDEVIDHRLRVLHRNFTLGLTWPVTVSGLPPVRDNCALRIDRVFMRDSECGKITEAGKVLTMTHGRRDHQIRRS
ncbi:MAG: hypothetical protein O2985_13305 [Proteobacteria bacterium]|nr:hypothetical protein [Pseudomonadota bacterium]